MKHAIMNNRMRFRKLLRTSDCSGILHGGNGQSISRRKWWHTVSWHDTADPSMQKTLDGIKRIGQEQFDIFVHERLFNKREQNHCTTAYHGVSWYHLTLLIRRSFRKAKMNLPLNDTALLSKLYIRCQNRGGNVDEFFKHENQAFPLSLSDSGKIQFSAKSELLTCFATWVPFVRESPYGMSTVILDGATVLQRLKPVGVTTFEQYARDMFNPIHYVTTECSWPSGYRLGHLQGGQFEVINQGEMWKRHPPAG